MSLGRVWTPSGNYSGGGSKRLLVIHTMEGFTGQYGARDCAVYFQGNVGASSQVCIDNNRGTIWEGVSRYNGAWTQCGFNSVAVSCEQSGYASWSTDYWMSNRYNQLRNVADWIAEEAAIFDIPIVLLSESQAQGGGRGICFHSHLGSSGCGHSDPGSNWPVQQVLDWALGGSPEAPEVGGNNVISSAIDPDGNTHYAGLNDSGQVMYFPPGWADWGVIDPNQSGAISGTGISITDEWVVKLTYTNSGKKPCEYYHTFNSGKPWVFRQIGSNVTAK